MSIDRVQFRPARIIATAALLFAGIFGVTACGSESATPSATKTVVATATQTVTATPSAPSASPTAASTPSADGEVGAADGGGDASSFSMPNEVGKVLQAAQDDLQARSGEPFFYSDSVDATGAGRFQILDSGWKVCSQNKAPGSNVGKDDTSVSFKVVRVEERCP